MQTGPPTSQLSELRSFLDTLLNEVTVARSLIEADRAVDLTGLDRRFGLLCAKALDLPPEDGRALRPDLIGLLALVDALIANLAAPTERA